jgi:hypothetical protein
VHPVAVRHRRDVARWALEHGHRVGRDALAVIVALRTDPVLGTLELSWSARQVDATVRVHADRWCSLHGAEPPPELPRTLAAYLRYLSSARLLGPGSDAPAELRRAVGELVDNPHATRERHPSRWRAPVLPLG